MFLDGFLKKKILDALYSSFKKNITLRIEIFYLRVLLSFHIFFASCLQRAVNRAVYLFTTLGFVQNIKKNPFVVVNMFCKPHLTLSFSFPDTLLPLSLQAFIPVRGYSPGLLYFEHTLYVAEFIRRQHVQTYPF